MKTKELKEKICEALEPEEIRELREAIREKEEEIDDVGDFELDESECDIQLDEMYPDVNLAGVTYSFSNVLKSVDECRYNEFRDEIEMRIIEEKEEVLNEELYELKGELDELLEKEVDEDDN